MDSRAVCGETRTYGSEGALFIYLIGRVWVDINLWWLYVFNKYFTLLLGVVLRPYYLNIIKEIFFYKPEYKINSLLKNKKFYSYIYNNNNVLVKNLKFEYNNIVMTSPISITISCITLIILLFILINQEWLSIGTILVQVLFNT